MSLGSRYFFFCDRRLCRAESRAGASGAEAVRLAMAEGWVLRSPRAPGGWTELWLCPSCGARYAQVWAGDGPRPALAHPSVLAEQPELILTERVAA
jgi:hypothetical protein